MKQTAQRIIPAVITFLPALLSGAFGVFSAYVMVYELSDNIVDDFNRIDVLACSLFYLGPGFAWTTSSVLFWKGRSGIAWWFIFVGLVIPIIVFVLMGDAV
jgi:hypothetical protein